MRYSTFFFVCIFGIQGLPTAESQTVLHAGETWNTSEESFSHATVSASELPETTSTPVPIVSSYIPTNDETMTTTENLVSIQSNTSAVSDRAERQFIPFKDLPAERRVRVDRPRLGLTYGYDMNFSYVTFSSPVPPDTQVQIGKPWLAALPPGITRSAPGYCPTKISYGLKQMRQEERPNIPWPYVHTESVREGDIETEKTSVRNLGNFYALIDPESGKFATMENRAEMPWRDNITQAEIEALCKQASERPSKTSYLSFEQDFFGGPATVHRTWIDGPRFSDHQPVDAKATCPGGGRDTFAATYGTFFELQRFEVTIRDKQGKILPGHSTNELVCKVKSQVCCFDSEAPWPLHSFYPGESGAGYDSPDPDFTPSEAELEATGRINYAYSFLGSKGLDLSFLSPEDLKLPSSVGGKDPWLKRLSPVLQPPRGEVPTLDKATRRKAELELDLPLLTPNPLAD